MKAGRLLLFTFASLFLELDVRTFILSVSLLSFRSASVQNLLFGSTVPLLKQNFLIFFLLLTLCVYSLVEILITNIILFLYFLMELFLVYSLAF